MKRSAIAAVAASRFVGPVVAAIIVVGLPAFAIAADDNTICFKESGPVAIAACDRVINSPRSSRDNLVDAYTNRGQEYYTIKDYDKAIADFDRAINLNPRTILAYGNRGNAKSAKGLVDAAIADYTKAISEDPNYTAAYTGRAMEYENKGEKARAIADYKKAISVPQKYQDGKWAHEKANDRLTVLGGN
jgi:tetratricopeptide (TPR) repeat protein